MASMPGIVIKIGTDATNAVKGLDRVSKSLNKVDSATRKSKAAWKALGVGAAAAATAFTAVAAESIQLFIDDQKEAETLAKTLSNLGFADAADDVSTFIDNLQFAVNVSESQLRPAFGNLVRATKDVKDAQDLLVQAVDISAGSGLELSAVTDTLAKAYAGNRKGLVGLKSGLDKAFLASAPMVDIIQALAGVFGGAAEAQAGTLSGGLTGVNNALAELKERFGAGLVGNINTTNDALTETEQRLRNLQPTAESAGGAARDAGLGAAEGFQRFWDVMTGDASGWDRFQQVGEWITGGMLPDGLFGAAAGLDATASSATFAASQMNTYAASLERAAAGLAAVEGGASGAVESVSILGDALGYATSGHDRARIGEALIQRAAKKAAQQRAQERAKKKHDRIEAVRLANAAADIVARAASRTGSKRATDRVQLNRRACA